MATTQFRSWLKPEAGQQGPEWLPLIEAFFAAADLDVRDLFKTLEPETITWTPTSGPYIGVQQTAVKLGNTYYGLQSARTTVDTSILKNGIWWMALDGAATPKAYMWLSGAWVLGPAAGHHAGDHRYDSTTANRMTADDVNAVSKTSINVPGGVVGLGIDGFIDISMFPPSVIADDETDQLTIESQVPLAAGYYFAGVPRDATSSFNYVFTAVSDKPFTLYAEKSDSDTADDGTWSNQGTATATLVAGQYKASLSRPVESHWVRCVVAGAGYSVAGPENSTTGVAETQSLLDVRSSLGASGGGSGVVLPIAETDVANLVDDLAARLCFRGNWAALTDFKANDVVFHPTVTNLLVRAKSDFTSAASYNPANWDKLAPSPDIQLFDASGTWTKPAHGTVARVYVLGAGHGGGGGAKNNSGSAAGGGGSGSGGAAFEATFLLSDLPSTVAVTIGAGGTGGNGATAVGSGSSGGYGGTTSFGSILNAGGSAGNPGGGGTTAAGGAAGNAGTTGSGNYIGQNGLSGNAATTATDAGAWNSGGGPCGGPGAGVNASNTAANGGKGGYCFGAAQAAGGAADGGAGANGNTTTNKIGAAGGGGGGGASSGTTNGGKGGNGAPGAGGGGGGASNAGNGGNGGDGGHGRVVVIVE